MTEEERERIRALREQGMTFVAIGQVMGVARSTARRNYSPEARAADLAHHRAYRQRNLARIREADRQYKIRRRFGEPLISEAEEMPYLRFLRERAK